MSTPAERYQTFDAETLAQLGSLLEEAPQAALATVDGGGPYCALVAFVATAGELLLHLSSLSPHKHHLLADPRGALLITGAGPAPGEVLQQARVTLRCTAAVLGRDAPEHAAARDAYLAKYRGHERMFALGDFDLVRLTPTSGVYIAGFGRAYLVDEAVFAAARAGAG